MENDKEYKIRVYVINENIGLAINVAIDCGLFKLFNSYDGMNGILAIYDGIISKDGIKELLKLGIVMFPLNNYEDFEITCPNCGNKISDDMILLSYDENVLSGYNICCDIDDCGCQMANVKFIG